jgi:hypothetical protein
MVEQQNPKEASGLGSRIFYAGFALILIILALETALFRSKEGDLDKAEWVVLYVGVALVTGIAFWILTPGSTGEVTVEHLGIKLGGGAAIGAAFMLLSNFVSEEPPNYRVFPEDDRCEQIEPAVTEEDGVEAIEIEKDEESLKVKSWLVEFKSSKGYFVTNSPYASPNTVRHNVTRKGSYECEPVS